MKVYTFSEARAKLAEVLDKARSEDILIKRRGGETFVLRRQRPKKSPLDIPGIKTKATTADIIEAVRAGREWPRRG